jgi:hypothetical protein
MVNIGIKGVVWSVVWSGGGVEWSGGWLGQIKQAASIQLPLNCQLHLTPHHTSA